jgi:hypothetical protein
VFVAYIFFNPVGLLYAVLAGLLYVLSFLRMRHSRHDFADEYRDDATISKGAIPTVGQENGRIFGRPFKTAGSIVIAVTTVVAAVEVALLVEVLRL